MGLFSDTKTYWSSTTTPLLDGEPEDLLKKTVLASVLDSSNLIDDLIINGYNGFGTRSLYYYNYANNNMDGVIPESTIYTRNVTLPVIEDLLSNTVLPPTTGISPQPVILLSAEISSPNPTSYALRYLSENNCGIDELTHQLAVAPPNFPYTASEKNIYFSYAELTATGFVDIYYKVTATSAGAPQLGFGDDSGDIVFQQVIADDFYLLVENPYPNENTYEFLTAKYYIADAQGTATGEAQYYIYSIDSQEHTEVNSMVDTNTGSGYFPAIHLIKDGVEVWSDEFKNSPDEAIAQEWKDYNNLCKYLQIDYQTMGEALIGENPDEPNEDYDEIDFAYVNLSIPIQTEDPYAIEYLFNYFTYLDSLSTSNRADFESAIGRSEIPKSSQLDIRDKHDYHVKLEWNFSEVNLVTGSIGEVGEYSKTINEGSYNSFGLVGAAWGSSEVILRKQVSSTQYIEVLFSGLLHTVYIYKHAYETDIARSFETNDDGELNDDFNIPLELPSVLGMSVVDRNKLMYEALRVSVNSKIRVKLKWYQSGAFQILMYILVIVMTIYGMPQGATLIETLLAVGTNIAINLAISYSIRIMVDKLGINGYLATVIAAVAAYYAGDATGAMPKADDILATVAWNANHVSTAIGEVIEIEYNKLIDASEDLAEDVRELEDFREANNLNHSPAELYSILGVNVPVPEVETAEEFFDRTTRTNPAILSLSFAEAYVDAMLTLPDTFNNTLKL